MASGRRGPRLRPAEWRPAWRRSRPGPAWLWSIMPRTRWRWVTCAVSWAMHAGELVLVAGGEEQAAVDGDEAARHREGVDHGIAHHEVVELVLAFLGMAREAVADLLDVVADLGVFEHEPLRPHLPDPRRARPGTPPRGTRRRWRDCRDPAGPALAAGRRIRRPSRCSRRRRPQSGDRDESGQRNSTASFGLRKAGIGVPGHAKVLHARRRRPVRGHLRGLRRHSLPAATARRAPA